ncbi:MAG: hypothetical protein ACRER2_19070 [Methylococcales bacterium]
MSMIEIDVRISELIFLPLGEPVVSQNQVLYFQSKSITDASSILTATGQADMILAGVPARLQRFSLIFSEF